MDKFWENYIKTRPADSKGAFDALKKMSQGPRTMAQGSRTGFKDGNGVYDEKELLGKRVKELMDEGYEFGEAVKQAMKEGYAEGGRIGFQGGLSVAKPLYNIAKPLINPLIKKYLPEIGGLISSAILALRDRGIIAPDADEMEKEAQRIRELSKPGETKPIDTGPIKTGETIPPKIDTTETFPMPEEKLPTTTGGSEIPEQTLKDFIFYNKKAPGEVKKEYGKKALEELDSETVNDINIIIKDYRDSKTRPAGIYTTIEGGRKRERFRPESTQPKMNEAEKIELIELVIDKYKEKENKLPSSTELQAFLPFINANSLTKKYNIKLGQRKTDYDRLDPAYIEGVRKNKQLKANENSTITNFAGENFFPDTIKLKDGSVVNAEEFFIDNLVKRTESGPGRKETVAITLKNKDLAKLFNTNERKIEEVIKNIRNSPDFKADYPPLRPSNYGQKITLERIKKAREYLTEQELKNVINQENQLWELNTMFKNGTLKVTDYPNLVKALNTTLDKNTGKLDHSIKKTNKEMIERSKDNSGLFDISHTIPKTSEQQNIEFIRNRNLADYKTNQGLFKSFEAYVRNQTDDPEYDLRLQEFDAYMKEMGQRVKIGNRFFGLDEAMIDSNTGEFLGINRQLEYYGLPKFKNGVPLKKVKKADGGPVKLDFSLPEGFAGGGMAGIRRPSAIPPESGPQSQGLAYLKKYGSYY